ncbi:radical SAM protein [Streptomyces zhihengii]|uniref:Radical SAM protein n=1 Tax=Streptomyces zhihengii TaxID=1818004 RepID=A0ABS2V4U8_9ACTN|nr:radical SAM protein [Streptomyces zhihengii]MBM9624704.1 radical SAM protein [Streptomyces zhihengii]
MTVRAFSTRVLGGKSLVYDPATELTHLAPQVLASGRCWLDGTQVVAWQPVFQRQVATAVPFNVCWSPLVRCNLECPQCLDDKTVQELRSADRARIARILATSGTLGLDISGGEPLLLRDLTALGRTLRSAGAVVSCTTNGWHLARRAPELVGVFDAIRVSLDGPTAATHDRWRGTGSFGRACEGVRAAVRAGLPVQLHFVVMQSTADGMQQMANLAARLGAGGVTFLQMLPIGDGRALRDTQMLSDAQARTRLDAVTPPPGVRVRLRTREIADAFTVVRADGKVWRNTDQANEISALRRLTRAEDLHLPVPVLQGSTP